MHSTRDSRSPTDEIREIGYRIFQAHSIEQVVPEGDPLFFASLFQTGEGVATSTPRVGSGAAADLSFDDVFPDIPFTQVVVKRDIRPFQHQQQLRFVIGQPLECLVEGLEAGSRAADFIEASG